MLEASGMRRDRWRWSRVVGSALALITVAATEAHAGDDVEASGQRDPHRASASLAYSSPDDADCPSRDDVAGRVQERLGYLPFSDDATAKVDVTIMRSDGGFAARVTLDDPKDGRRGERELHANACRELSEAMTLTIALMLDPRSLTRAEPKHDGERPPEREPKPTGATTKARPAPWNEPDPFAPEKPRPVPPRPKPWRLRFGAGVVGSVNAGPGPTAGLEAMVGIERGAFVLDLEGRADLPSTKDDGQGRAVSASLLVGTIAPCLKMRRLGLCALAQLGALNAEGIGAGLPEMDTAFYAAAGIRPFIELPIVEQWLVRFHPDLTAPLTPTSTTVAGTTVWSTPAIAIALGLDIVGRFP